MFPLLREFWEAFIEADKNSKKVVLLEGGMRLPRKNEQEAVEKDSEGGLLALWAYQNGVATESIEPARGDESKLLLERFDRDAIAYYYFIRTVHQWLRTRKGQVEFEEYINRSLGRNAEAFEWEGYDFSLAHMKALHKDYFKHSFDDDLSTQDEQYFLDLFISIKDRSNINRVGAELATIRNIHMIMKIQEKWDAGFSIFTALGQSHVILQERAIRAILNFSATM